MKKTQQGFLSIIGLVVVLALMGFIIYRYIDVNTETGTSILKEGQDAIKQAEDAKKLIEDKYR